MELTLFERFTIFIVLFLISGFINDSFGLLFRDVMCRVIVTVGVFGSYTTVRELKENPINFVYVFIMVLPYFCAILKPLLLLL